MTDQSTASADQTARPLAVATDRVGSTAGIADQVRELFDAKAANWAAKYALDGRLAGRVPAFKAALSQHVPVGGRILDLGCGTGELARAMAVAGYPMTACDISEQMLCSAIVRDQENAVDWVQLEPGWLMLPFRSKTFDAVVASSVLEYVDDPTAVLRECSRILRPGGTMLCTVPNSRHPIRWLEWLISGAGLLLVRWDNGRWPQLDGYLAYLRISRQRHSSRWWHAVAARANLAAVLAPPQAGEHSPLRLLTFQRPCSIRDNS